MNGNWQTQRIIFETIQRIATILRENSMTIHGLFSYQVIPACHFPFIIMTDTLFDSGKPSPLDQKEKHLVDKNITK